MAGGKRTSKPQNDVAGGERMPRSLQLTTALKTLGHFIRYHARPRKNAEEQRDDQAPRSGDGDTASAAAMSRADVCWYVPSKAVKELREDCDKVKEAFERATIVPDLVPTGESSPLDRAYLAVAEIRSRAPYSWGVEVKDVDLTQPPDQLVSLLHAAVRFLEDLWEKEGVSVFSDCDTITEAVEHERRAAARRWSLASGAHEPSYKLLKPSAEMARKQYRRACKAMDNERLADKVAYAWLKKRGEDLPELLETWSRYVRAARQHFNEPKNRPRGRPTESRSVVDPKKDPESAYRSRKADR